MQLLNKFEIRDARVREILAQALDDPLPEVRLCALEIVEHAKENSFVSRLFDLLQSERNEIVKEKIVTVLGEFKDTEVIVYLLKLLMDSNQKIRAATVSSLEKNLELMVPDVRKLFDLMRDIAEKKRSLTMIDKVFLWRFSRKHPEMDDVVQTLKELAGNAGDN